jgi:signal transduction histidine kinase
VRDRGRGISQENRARIFDAFEQASLADEQQGTGLGLAICKLIAEAHGGKVWAEPADELDESKGSIFRLFIPNTGS